MNKEEIKKELEDMEIGEGIPVGETVAIWRNESGFAVTDNGEQVSDLEIDEAVSVAVDFLTN